MSFNAVKYTVALSMLWEHDCTITDTFITVHRWSPAFPLSHKQVCLEVIRVDAALGPF